MSFCASACVTHNSLSPMQFLWSDAWLLQAIVLAARQGPASLGAVLAAADGVNHALPTDDELHGALYRLTAAGFVEELNERFAPTARIPAATLTRIVTGGWRVGRTAASVFLGAEEWSAAKNVKDPRNAVRYPGLSRERLLRADKERRT